MNEPTNQPMPSESRPPSAGQVAAAFEPATSEDRRWALLAYLFTPVVPLLLFFVEPARDRPFVRQHMIQALALGVVQVALLVLAPFTFCISTVAFLLLYVAIFYWGFRAYNGEVFEIPYVTEYLTKQGWLQAWQFESAPMGNPYRFINFYVPFLGAGIHVDHDGGDPYTMRVSMRLTPLNKNLFGTHFGGSLYAMCDPFFALILARCLGPSYVVWDKSACINFVRPGRGTVCANFHIPPEQVDGIRARVDAGEVLEPTFQVDVLDEAGQVVAHVDKRLYVRRKR